MQHAFCVHADSDQCLQGFRDDKINEIIVDTNGKIIYAIIVVRIKINSPTAGASPVVSRFPRGSQRDGEILADRKNNMKNVVKLGDGITLSPMTNAQMAAIAARDGGLDYPVQGRGLRAGKFILPLWTDGDGGCYAIGRTGGVVELF